MLEGILSFTLGYIIYGSITLLNKFNSFDIVKKFNKTIKIYFYNLKYEPEGDVDWVNLSWYNNIDGNFFENYQISQKRCVREAHDFLLPPIGNVVLFIYKLKNIYICKLIKKYDYEKDYILRFNLMSSLPMGEL